MWTSTLRIVQSASLRNTDLDTIQWTPTLLTVYVHAVKMWLFCLKEKTIRVFWLQEKEKWEKQSGSWLGPQSITKWIVITISQWVYTYISFILSSYFIGNFQQFSHKGLFTLQELWEALSIKTHQAGRVKHTTGSYTTNL